MATKKRTTTQATKQDDAADLARHINAIFNYPTTPVCIYNALADAVCSLDLPKGYTDSVAYLTPILAYNDRTRGEE